MDAATTPFVTVDGPSTRDIDDAFSLERAAEGWRLRVAIAVPAAHVEPDSTLDAYARKLAATVYASTRVVKSMLPLGLSEDLCSLTAGTSRQAMLIEMEIGPDLGIRSTEVSFEQITVASRLTYEDVPRLAADPEQGVLCTMMQDAISLSRALLNSRRNAGALAFFDLAKLLYLDEEGAIRRAATAGDMAGHIVIQEFMVLTNMQVARWAIEREIPFIYRTHRAKLAAPPAAELLETIQTWGNDPQRARQSEEALMERLSVIMGSASYAPHALGHYALNLPFYAHCTSPLRRYVDLVNQRQILAHCLATTPPHTQEEMAEISQSINDTLAQAKIDRSASFKGVVVDRAARAVGTGQIERMGDPELVQAIKLSVGSGAMPEPLAAHLANKIAEGSLPDKVMDVLVTASTGVDIPETLLAAWTTFMTAEPHRAKHFLMFALQTNLAVEHSTNDEALNGRGFIVRVSFRRVCDNALLHASAAAPRKKDAENLASARLMCSFMGAAGIPSQPTENLEPTAVIAAATVAPLSEGPRRNFKGEILEFCQKRKLQPPVFEVIASGPTNDARFTCKAHMTLGEKTPMVTFTDARTKKEAEAGAAQKLLFEVGLI